MQFNLQSITLSLAKSSLELFPSILKPFLLLQKPFLENVIPIQCSQTVPKTVSQEVTATPPSTIKTDRKKKTVSQTKKSKSFDSSKICRSNRIASCAGVKPVIDTTVYSISDSDDTLSDTPKTMSGPQIKTYSRKNSLSKAKPKLFEILSLLEKKMLLSNNPLP
ncbi:hypothetical protein QL285_058273 [Trifolium repens]|nr:hypothetical protein QL285_058273 [Trifolium repens]